MDLDEIVRGEFSANAYRKDFTLSEKYAISRALEQREKAKARERQRATRLVGKGVQAKKNGGGNSPPPSKKGKSRDLVAASLGLSGKSLEKVKKIVETAERYPDRFQDIVEEMDRTGKIEPAYRKVMKASADEEAPADDKALTDNKSAVPAAVEVAAATKMEVGQDLERPVAQAKEATAGEAIEIDATPEEEVGQALEGRYLPATETARSNNSGRQLPVRQAPPFSTEESPPARETPWEKMDQLRKRLATLEAEYRLSRWAESYCWSDRSWRGTSKRKKSPKQLQKLVGNLRQLQGLIGTVADRIQATIKGS